MTLSVVMRAPGPGTILPLEAMKSFPFSQRKKEGGGLPGQAARGPGLISAPPRAEISHVAMPTGSGWGQGWSAESWAPANLARPLRPHQLLSARLKPCFLSDLRFLKTGASPQSGDHSRMKEDHCGRGVTRKGCGCSILRPGDQDPSPG